MSNFLTVAEFFAGIGLVRLGLENKGWEIKFANDIDIKKYEMYAHNFPDSEKYYSVKDIQNLKGADIPLITLATASFPCNDTSLAGSYQGLAGKHSSAIWEFLRIIKEMGSDKPPLILLENVLSFIASNKGQDLSNVLSALNELGYVCDLFAVDAAQFVPQSRIRLFVVGSQKRKDDYSRPSAGQGFPLQMSSVRPKRLVDFISQHPEIHWQLRDLPVLPQRMKSLSDILEDIPHTSELWWNDERRQYLWNQLSERHAAIAEKMIKSREYQYGTIFRRVRKGRSMAELRVDGIAGCLRTPRGGSGRQILFKAGCGEYQVRLLTPRECARLQGVSDQYRIEVPLNQALFGFGDAVCVPVIEWIAENYLNPLIDDAHVGHKNDTILTLA